MHIGNLCRGDFASRMNIAAKIVSMTNTPERCVFPVISQRLTVHEEKSCVASHGIWQVLLGNHITIPADSLDDLVEI